MSEQQKNTNQLVKSAMTDENRAITAAIGTLVKFVIMPSLLWYGSHALDRFADEIKDLRKDVTDTSSKLDTYKATSDAYKEIVNKQLEFLDYRINLLETLHGRYEKLYTEFYSKHNAGQTRNVSTLGKSVNGE